MTPAWVLYDLVTQKETFLAFYKQTELLLKRKWIALPAITLVIANWIWNIYKGV